jgi:hypothetical protein
MERAVTENIQCWEKNDETFKVYMQPTLNADKFTVLDSSNVDTGSSPIDTGRPQKVAELYL